MYRDMMQNNPEKEANLEVIKAELKKFDDAKIQESKEAIASEQESDRLGLTGVLMFRNHSMQRNRVVPI